jgi:hypothetical protein
MMNRTSSRKLSQLLLAALVALSALAAGAARASAQANISLPGYQAHTYNFDQTVDPWVGGRYKWSSKSEDLGMAQPVLSLGMDYRKGGYALFTNTGYDAMWMETSFEATASNVFFIFDVANVDNGERLAPIVYIGKEAPTSLSDFQMPGNPLGKERQTLYTQLDLAEAKLVGQQFVIAIGFMNLDGEQAQQNALVDNVRVLIHDGD